MISPEQYASNKLKWAVDHCSPNYAVSVIQFVCFSNYTDAVKLYLKETKLKL